MSVSPVSNSDDIVFLNGNFLNRVDAMVPVDNRGFLLGDGVFDTLSVKDGTPLYAEDHIKRLLSNASVMNMVLPYGEDEILDILQRLITQNKSTSGSSHASIRTTVTRGSGPRGLGVSPETALSILMTIAPYDPAAFASPLKIIIAKSVRRNEGSPLSRIKSLNYGDNILAKIEAQKAGADEAIMLNNAGFVCCGTSCNVFVRNGDQYTTPPLSDGVLDGITRHHFIKENLSSVDENHITPEQLMAADEIWLTNSLRGRQTATLLCV